MKKRLPSLLLIAVMLLSLTGCECNHRWSEADCVNASACDKCGEIQREALGHEWSEADCLNPETCSRCGETQGEAKGHMYTAWKLSKTDMSRSCEICDEVETSAINYEAFLAQQLPGYWNMTRMLYAYGGSAGPEDLGSDTIDPNIAFFEDGTASILGSDAEITWTIGQAEYDDEAGAHMIGIEVQSSEAIGSYSLMCYPQPSSISDKLVEIPLRYDVSKMLYSKDQSEMLADILTGSWCAVENDRVYNISFGENHSFSADFDGEISGYWQPRTIDEDLIILIIYKDEFGETKIVSAEPYSPLLGQIGNISGYSKEQLSLILTEIGYIKFSPGTAEDLKKAENQVYEELCGLWTSTSAGIFTMFEQNITPTTQFSMTLNEDGSFTAQLDREISGSWTLTNTTSSGGMFMHDLLLTSESWSRTVSMSINPSGAELIIDRGNDTERYYFSKMSEEEIAEYKRLMEEAPRMIVGKWEGTNGSAQFNEDGSMSLDFGTVYEGFWSFTRMYKADTNTLHVIYTLDCPDFYNCTMHVSNDSRKIIIFSAGSSYELFLPEEFSEVMDELERVPGRWSSSTMYIHDENREIAEEASGEYYLELKEGGSFSGYLGRNVSGRWQFSGSEGDALQFVFHLNGNEKTGYIYDLVDGVLQAWLYNSDGKQLSFELTK